MATKTLVKLITLRKRLAFIGKCRGDKFQSTLFVRKTAKDYGTCQLVEGGTVGGRRIVIVEDVVTSGGQVLNSAQELKKLGAEIIGVLCVVDREAGGRAALEAAGLEMTALFRMTDLKRY